MRSVIAVPGAKAWPKLAEQEGRLLAVDGLVTGLGLAAETAGLDGFLEGDAWHKGDDGIEARQAFRHHWRVRWPSLPQTWSGGGELVFDLDLLAESTGAAPIDGMTLRFDVAAACMPRMDMVKWLDDLERNGPAAMERLAAMACKGQREGAPETVVVRVEQADYANALDGRAVKSVHVPLPAAWEQGIQAASGRDVRRLVLTVHFQLAEAAPVSGDAMFRQAVAVFVFGPEV